MMTYGQIAYDAYREHTDGKSLATGADLPRWDKLSLQTREAWEVAAQSVRHKVQQLERKQIKLEAIDLGPCCSFDFIANPNADLRDWFAAAMLIGTRHTVDADEAGRVCYMFADAMMAARGARKTTDRPNDAA